MNNLALAAVEVLEAVLAASAEVAGAQVLDLHWGWAEVALAPVRHQPVDHQVELDCAVVRRKLGWEVREVGVEDGDQGVAVGEPAAC